MAEVTKVRILPTDPNVWVDLNTETGIAVGTDVSIQNTGTAWFYIQEKDTEPVDDDEGKIVTSLRESSPEVVADDTPLKLWVRSCSKDQTIKLAVQVI